MKYTLTALFFSLAMSVHADKIKCFRLEKDNPVKINIDKNHHDGRLMIAGNTVKLSCQGELVWGLTCDGSRSTVGYHVQLSKRLNRQTASHFTAKIERTTKDAAAIKTDLGTISCFELK